MWHTALPVSEETLLSALVEKEEAGQSVHVPEDVDVGKDDVSDVLRRREEQEHCGDKQQHGRQLPVLTRISCNAPGAFSSRLWPLSAVCLSVCLS